MDKKQTIPTIKYRWLPTPGNIIFSLLLVGLLILTQRVWATPAQNTDAPGLSATTVNYQGHLAAPNGTPKNGSFDMSFAIYNAASGGSLVWGPENHSAVPVTNGLFNIGLGSKTSSGIPTTVWNGDRFLQITVGGETLTPRELIRGVPIAGMALTVPDGTITQKQAPSLLASASGNNAKVFFGSASVNSSGSQFLLSKTVFLPESCQTPIRVFVQPYWNYHADVSATVGSPLDDIRFTAFFSKTGGGAWTDGQIQSFDWFVICQ